MFVDFHLISATVPKKVLLKRERTKIKQQSVHNELVCQPETLTAISFHCVFFFPHAYSFISSELATVASEEKRKKANN